MSESETTLLASVPAAKEQDSESSGDNKGAGTEKPESRGHKRKLEDASDSEAAASVFSQEQDQTKKDGDQPEGQEPAKVKRRIR